MKVIILFTTLFILNVCSWSQGIEACLNWGGLGPCPYQKILEEVKVCGVTSRENIFNKKIELIDTNTGNLYVVTPNKQEADAFIDLISVHGAKACHSDLDSDAPFEICFNKESVNNENYANSIFCGERLECVGFYCGGNGISVNSGGL
jgi:hypothetical protein